MSSRLPRALWNSAAGRWGTILCALLLVAGVGAPVFAPNGPGQPDDLLGAAGRPPLTRLQVVKLDDDSRLYADDVEWLNGELLLHRPRSTLTLSVDRIESPAEGKAPERVLFLLGTDRLGRDVWARTAYGARTSLTIGVLSAFLALTVGAIVGGTAAVSPAWLDSLLMRIVDGFLALPTLVLLLVLAALFQPNTWVLILLIGSAAWMGAARIAHAEVTSLRQREFIVAARGIGQSPRRIFFGHLLPNATAPLLVDTSLRVGATILAETSLSFLGLGVPPDVPSWGGMIAHGRPDLATLWWTTTFPGVAIVITVVGFNLLADGLRDALDPRLALARPDPS